MLQLLEALEAGDMLPELEGPLGAELGGRQARAVSLVWGKEKKHPPDGQSSRAREEG